MGTIERKYSPYWTLSLVMASLVLLLCSYLIMLLRCYIILFFCCYGHYSAQTRVGDCLEGSEREKIEVFYILDTSEKYIGVKSTLIHFL